jgi:hypothetical protein
MKNEDNRGGSIFRTGDVELYNYLTFFPNAKPRGKVIMSNLSRTPLAGQSTGQLAHLREPFGDGYTGV